MFSSNVNPGILITTLKKVYWFVGKN